MWTVVAPWRCSHCCLFQKTTHCIFSLGNYHSSSTCKHFLIVLKTLPNGNKKTETILILVKRLTACINDNNHAQLYRYFYFTTYICMYHFTLSHNKELWQYQRHLKQVMDHWCGAIKVTGSGEGTDFLLV